MELINYLKENKIIKEEDKIATNFLEIHDNEVVISGNKLGLICLAEYLVNIAVSEIPGAHIHLDEYNFFDSSNIELIISKVTDKTLD